MITVRANNLVVISFETDLAGVWYLGTAAVHQDTTTRNPSGGRTLTRAVRFIEVELPVSWYATSED